MIQGETPGLSGLLPTASLVSEWLWAACSDKVQASQSLSLA